MTKQMLFSAVQVAEILYFDAPQVLLPTAEQSRVIEAPLGTQYLVVAGAGSGKTETIAQRVVWLIANGLVQPQQVLGLTFTNKAAGELSERVLHRLQKFVHSALREDSGLSSKQLQQVQQLQQQLEAGYAYPEISTYNAFAAGIVREFGVVAGLNPSAKVMDEATAVLLAEEIILQQDSAALQQLQMDSLTAAAVLIKLENAIVDNAVDVRAVQAEIDSVLQLQNLPRGSARARTALSAGVKRAASEMQITAALLPLIAAYRTLKATRNLQEFSDQVAGAVQAVTATSHTVAKLRERHRVILLDEVQDTSVGQTELLTTIFKGADVMGVGDPHQSIYGWRGASAESLEKFLPNFSGYDGHSAGELLTLSTSFRNSRQVLAVANQIVSQLQSASRLQLPQLQPRQSAPEGQVVAASYETSIEEETAVAAEIERMRLAAQQEQQEPPTIAIILRTRKDMEGFAAALRRKNIPYTIVGLGGLLTAPEVVELISVAKIVAQLDATNELVRLLVGPRFNVGLHDLAQLSKIARTLQRQDSQGTQLSAAAAAADEVLTAPERTVTIVQALDSFAQRTLHDELYRDISAAGKARLREAAQLLCRLRKGAGADVLELFYRLERELRLDIELAAHPKMLGAKAQYLIDPRSNLDRFLREVAGYLSIHPEATLKQVLVWLEMAQQSDKIPAQVPAPTPDTVQIITSHSAKGLEWDAVFVPRLVAGGLPTKLKDSYGWLTRGVLPSRLGKDHAALPQLQLQQVTDQDNFDKVVLQDYREALAARHSLDERRVAYVTFTRAKKWLYLSYCFWQKELKTPAEPSPYIAELITAEILPQLQEATEHSEKPATAANTTQQHWPLDPLGARRANFMAAAAAVRQASVSLANAAESNIAPLSELQQLLLLEAQQTQAQQEALPNGKINASAFAQALADPQQYQLQLLRPVPQRPYRGADIGTRFHEWVQAHYATAAVHTPQLAGLESPAGEGIQQQQGYEMQSAKTLQKLQHNFSSSKWYRKQPIAVEQEILMPFAGEIMHCKMDAVFAWQQSDGSEIIEIVDWKTGKAPVSDAEKFEKFLQLQLYRHAYLQEYKLAPEQVTATLFYVSENRTLRLDELPEAQILTLADLEQRYRAAQGSAGAPEVSASQG